MNCVKGVTSRAGWKAALLGNDHRVVDGDRKATVDVAVGTDLLTVRIDLDERS